MIEWVRLWHDMPTDPKWRTIARKSGQPLPSVIAVFTLILVNASANSEERGTLRNWDHEDAAAALDMEPEAVMAIIDAMQGKVLQGDALSGWERRQPKREDTSADRVRAFRERTRTQGNAGGRTVTQEKRTVTQCNAPDKEEEKEEETEKNISTPQPAAEDAPDGGSLRYTVEFEAWWAVYPRKTGKVAAFEAYKRAKKKIGVGAADRLSSAVLAFAISMRGREERFIPHPNTWLNQGRWDDDLSGPSSRPDGRPGLPTGRDAFGVGG